MWYECRECGGPVEDGECAECGNTQPTYEDMLGVYTDYAYERMRDRELGWDDSPGYD
jgi:hypothetical protein